MWQAAETRGSLHPNSEAQEVHSLGKAQRRQSPRLCGHLLPRSVQKLFILQQCWSTRLCSVPSITWGTSPSCSDSAGVGQAWQPALSLAFSYMLTFQTHSMMGQSGNVGGGKHSFSSLILLVFNFLQAAASISPGWENCALLGFIMGMDIYPGFVFQGGSGKLRL